MIPIWTLDRSQRNAERSANCLVGFAIGATPTTAAARVSSSCQRRGDPTSDGHSPDHRRTIDADRVPFPAPGAAGSPSDRSRRAGPDDCETPAARRADNEAPPLASIRSRMVVPADQRAPTVTLTEEDLEKLRHFGRSRVHWSPHRRRRQYCVVHDRGFCQVIFEERSEPRFAARAELADREWRKITSK